MVKTIKQLNPEIRIVLLGILIINIGNFMVIPYLSLYLRFTKELPPAQVGVVLTTSIIFQYGLSFVGGALSDKFGKKNLLILGLGGRSLGLLMYIFSDSLYMYMVSSALIGIGQSFYTPSSKAIIASVSSDIKVQVFALRSTAVNIGAAFGPILGGLLFKATSTWVFLLSLIIHILVLFLISMFVKDDNKRNDESPQKNNVLKLMINVVKDKRITILMVFSSFFWFLYFQINFTIPIYVKETFNSPSLVGVLFTMNGILVILLQFGLIKWITKKINSYWVLSLGMLFISLAFLTLGFSPEKYSLFIFIFLFTIGEMLFIPSSDTIASDLAPKELLGGYIGLMTIGWALGGMFGNIAGGYLYQYFTSTYYTTKALWFLYTALGVLVAALLLASRNFILALHKNRNSIF